MHDGLCPSDRPSNRRALALMTWRNQARYPSPPVTLASTHIRVTCKQRDAGFNTEKQKCDTQELLCTDIFESICSNACAPNAERTH
jgi:hypothetical protein